MNWNKFLPPYQGSTVIGIGIVGGAVSAWLLEQMTWKQAVATAIAGLIQMLIRQTATTSGEAVVIPPGVVVPIVKAAEPAPGSLESLTKLSDPQSGVPVHVVGDVPPTR